MQEQPMAMKPYHLNMPPAYPQKVFTRPCASSDAMASPVRTLLQAFREASEAPSLVELHAIVIQHLLTDFAGSLRQER